MAHEDKSLDNWEDLRREARRLENEIDSKLILYSKVGSNAAFSNTSDLDSDKRPLLFTSTNSTDMTYDALSEEIEELIKKLSHVNENMTQISVSTPGLITREAAHTLQRHLDIFKDYSQEFKKTQNNLRSRKEREELLQGVKNDIDSSKTALNRRLDLYMKEHDHLKASERLVDEQISIAIETKENLVNQRVAFKKIQSRMNDITSRFPALNSLISKINLKKRKDSIIIGVIIGTCIFFMIIYMIH